MPHRVTSFFRSSSSSSSSSSTPSSSTFHNPLDFQVSTFKRAKGAVRRTSPASSSRSSRSSERVFSYALSLGDDADEANSSATTATPPPPPPPPAIMKTAVVHPSSALRSSAMMEKHDSHQEAHHRISFGGLHFGRSSRETQANPNVSLDWKIESPPIVLYGDAESSSGALTSGLLFLAIREDGLQMESFSASLNIHVTQKRPFTMHCNECTHQYTEIAKWNFMQTPLTLTRGEHAFPFSFLLGGHLPASLDGPLVSIAYEFKAEAVPRAGFGVPVKFEKVFDVKRSLPSPELPHHSVRVFPPTNIKASVHFPQVIYPIGQNTLSLRMDGIAKVNPKVSTVEYWKLRKLTWRLEETSRTVAPACDKHCPRDPKDSPQLPPPKKGVQRTDTRIIGERTLFSGWKSNYAGAEDSSVEIELEYSLAKGAKFACDTKARDGSEVTHQLMVEMVVSQEWAPVGKPSMVTQTGVGRILRMHFATTLTERGGIGISWDNEAPPIYQDVPPSPPSYTEEIGEGIEEHLEALDAVGSRSSVDD